MHGYIDDAAMSAGAAAFIYPRRVALKFGHVQLFGCCRIRFLTFQGSTVFGSGPSHFL
jgi:hypothetical protein